MRSSTSETGLRVYWLTLSMLGFKIKYSCHDIWKVAYSLNHKCTSTVYGKNALTVYLDLGLLKPLVHYPWSTASMGSESKIYYQLQQTKLCWYCKGSDILAAFIKMVPGPAFHNHKATQGSTYTVVVNANSVQFFSIRHEIIIGI